MDPRNSMRYFIILLLLFFPVLIVAQAPDYLKITYIGNMGVLLESGDQKVLIDGLHTFYKKAYQPPPDTLVDQLIIGDVGLVLNTHVHGDHFSPTLTRLYLEQNPKGFFVGSVQARDSILTQTDKAIDRILAPQPEGRVGTIVEVPDYEVTAYAITHSNPRRHRVIQNIGYVIEINNKKILHIGDADINPRMFHEIDFYSQNIDVAILPDWFLYGDYGPEIVEKFIGPKDVIATHISPGDELGVGPKILKVFPDTILFSKVGQTVTF
ncbi:MAG: MBL fold metallo-hydrolase [Cyclobacteriaceae bacterium]